MRVVSISTTKAAFISGTLPVLDPVNWAEFEASR
jgi:hypothetical protein